jgi:uncharacterized SAM-binding protein YcdF (DUF218 family)
MLVLLGLAVWGFLRRSRWIEGAALIGLFVVAWQPAVWVASQPLEAWYPPSPPALDGAGAIVVLAAGIRPPDLGVPEARLEENTYARCEYGAWLWKRSPQLPVLVCGGTTSYVTTPAAEVMRRAMIAAGVPESLVWMEDRSRSTYENALFGAGFLRQKGIRRVVLVTEAYHMLRSERCFRKQGMDVIAAPCEFTTVASGPSGLVPDGNAVLGNEAILHELVGLGWYKVKGRI